MQSLAFRRDIRIWMVCTLYGLFTGIISYASSLSDEDAYADWLAFVMNYPAYLLLFSASFNHPMGIIMVSAAMWSLIGLLVQGPGNMLRLGP